MCRRTLNFHSDLKLDVLNNSKTSHGKGGRKVSVSDSMDVKKKVICNFSEVCRKIQNNEATALCLLLNAEKNSTEDPLGYVILCIYL